MSDDPLSSFKSLNVSGLASWEGFLPPGAIVMARARSAARESSAVAHEAEQALAGAEVAPIPAVAGGTKLRFQLEAPGTEIPAQKELFDKILSALELSPSDYEISSHIGTGVDALVTVRFHATMDEQGDVGSFEPGFEGGVVISTFSLAAMLENTALKKPVWAHLKEALARVRSEVS